jgi:hypothetical protein
LSVDLGSAFKVDSVNLMWETARAATYKIQYSADNATWLDAITVTNNPGGTVGLKFPAVTGRYFRMYGMTRATQWGYSLWEFRIYRAKNNGYGGVMVWELGRGYENSKQPLAEALNHAIGGTFVPPPIDTTHNPPPPVVNVCDTAYKRGVTDGKASILCPPAVHDTLRLTTTITVHDTLKMSVTVHDTLWLSGLGGNYKYFSSSYSDSSVSMLIKNGALIFYMGTKSSTTGLVPIRGYKP